MVIIQHHLNIGSSFDISIVANYVGSNGNYYNKASLVVANNSNTLTISPSSSIMEPSFTQPFVLLYNGSPVVANEVQWYINGVLNGNTLVGTIWSRCFIFSTIFSSC